MFIKASSFHKKENYLINTLNLICMPLKSILSDLCSLVRLTTGVDPTSRLIPTTGMIPQKALKNMPQLHKRDQKPIKILGLTFTPEVFNMWDYNAPEILQKITKLLEIWSKRKLTLQGRITIIKSLAI